MKGGVTYEEAWGLSFSDRERIARVLNRRHKEQSNDTTEYM